jgi:ABC-type transport system involved in cytochrome c biogenesis permease subunit
MKTFEKYFPLGIVVLAAVMLLGRASVPSAKDTRPDLYGFGAIPVQHGGRVQPMDTLARNSLLVISGKTEVEGADKTYTATEWLLTLWGKPATAQKLRVVRIDHPQVLSLMDLPGRPGFYRYSMAELEDRDREKGVMRKLDNQRDVAARKAKEQRDSYDMKVLELTRQLHVYRELQEQRVPGLVPADEPDGKWLSYLDCMVRAGMQFRQEVIPQADKEVEEQFKDPDLRARVEERFGKESLPRVVEMMKDRRAQELMFEKARAALPTAYPPAAAIDQITNAYQEDDPVKFNGLVAEYHAKHTAGVPEADRRKAGLEARLNHFDPFLQCVALYVGVFVLAALSWLVWREPLRKAAFNLACLTLVVHTAALVARMYIMGRPPVTNLYSSAVFIGWGGLGMCLILERIYKLGIGSFVGGVLGFATTLIARFLGTSGDTLEMLQAVLDTNFWLATHVTTVTLGYMATFVAGVFAWIYIVGGVFSTAMRGETGRKVAGMMYGTLCFATLLSFVGTVLGGIWADVSWGRFWGWDPKENGAVLIVIWNALILHARWAGLVKARGMAILAVAGNMVVAWSWFGTNQLGIGLHAYGFDNRLATGCAVFWVSQLMLIGLGLVPARHWASLADEPRGAGR